MTTSQMEPANQPLQGALPLFDFSQSTLPEEFSFSNVEANLRFECLEIKALSKKHFYTSVFIEPQQNWDWSDLGNFCFTFDARALDEHSTQMFINIFDHQGQMHSRCINIAPGKQQSFMVELKGETLHGGACNYASGLRSNPCPWGTKDVYATWMWGALNIDLSAISKIELSIHGSLLDHHLLLSNFRLQSSPAVDPNYLSGIIDRFGQNAQQEHAQKIHSEQELAEVTKAELTELAKGPMLGRSKFGGYLDGPRQQASGYFRTEKIAGKWSLVDPEGYPYFATGLDIIRLANTSTITGIDYDHKLVNQRDDDDVTPEDSKEKVTVPRAALATAKVASEVRRAMYQWLPDYNDPLAEHYGYMRELFEGAVEQGETYSFYAANLQRKYGADGADYMAKWRDVTVDRMLNWGFTCLGNWTAPEFYDNQRIPFFANGWIIGEFDQVSSGDDFWAALPDPFDPRFRQRAAATVSQVKNEIKDTPWCVGIFIDNEKSWGRMGSIDGHYGIAIHTLGRSADACPTKAVFVELLKTKYTVIEALNQSWQTNLASWADLAKGVKGLTHNSAQVEDYALLLEAFASEYFRVVKQELKKQLPNHLYLGCRFADWGMNPEVVRAAAKHVDVVSYNYYKEGLHPEPWSFLADIDMPSIIGEFHFGALDSGFFHAGLVTAYSQQERGQMFERYMQTVVDNPYFVGAHYFQYIDSPITGRSFDGENYNIGFVSISDVPYQPMVDAAKRVNQSMYPKRFRV